MSVLCVGEALWDLLPTGPALGGAPLNVAFRVNQSGGRGRIATRLGKDDLGRRAIEQLARMGLATELVQEDPEKPTGTVPVSVDAAGTPTFDIRKDVAFDQLAATPELLEAASTADAVVYGSLIRRTAGGREALGKVLDAAAKALKFCDLNLRAGCYTRETLRDCIERADVLKLNESEAREVAELYGIPSETGRTLIDRLARAANLEVVVVTLGAMGAVVQKGEEWLFAPAFEAEVVDTCGAGDAFSAGFLRAYLDGKPLGVSCRWGNTFGALAAGQAGATEPFPEDWSERAGRMIPVKARSRDMAYWVA